MTIPVSLDALRRLLLTFPGVVTATLYRDGDLSVVDVRFRCTNLDSLKEIARSACWANVLISLHDYRTRFCGEPEPSEGLPCDLRIPDAVTESPTQTEILGVYLSEALWKMGLLSDEERNHLHILWNTSLLQKGRQ
jgi:hypothetical protein